MSGIPTTGERFAGRDLHHDVRPVVAHPGDSRMRSQDRLCLVRPVHPEPDGGRASRQQVTEHALGEDDPVLHDRDPIAYSLHLAEKVARQENRLAVIGESPYEAAHLPDALRVQPVQRLVEDQDVGVAQERNGQG